jgi:small subunit ribosomal protein S16
LIAIRLTRKGSKKKPVYRVVVAEKTAPRDGRFLEILGHYNPIPNPAEFQLDLERVNHWLSKGAKPSDTVRRLIEKATASAKSN